MPGGEGADERKAAQAAAQLSNLAAAKQEAEAFAKTMRKGNSDEAQAQQQQYSEMLGRIKKLEAQQAQATVQATVNAQTAADKLLLMSELFQKSIGFQSL